jgi:threonine/homoserine/homoserine lactone efflux protein
MNFISLISLMLQGLALGLSAAASPGPLQSYLITQTLAGGWRRGAPVAFAPLVSDGPIIVTLLFLLDRLPDTYLRLISLAGGLFVLYLAWGLLRQWLQTLQTVPEQLPNPPEKANPAGIRALGQGVMMNLLSPGPYTFWALVNGPILLSAWRQSPAHAGSFLLGFYAALVGGMLVIAGFFHQARRFGPKFVRALTLISIIVLVLFGGLLLYRGFIS